MIGLVLAGGASRRMGTAKALLPVDGEHLASTVARVLVGAGADRVLLIGGDPAWGQLLELEQVADRWPGEGPLGALATGLLAASTLAPGDGLALVAACDQVGLEAVVLTELADALRRSRPDAVAAAPHTPDGRRHPFPAAWRTTCGPALAALVEAGSRRADAAFGCGPVLDVAVAPEVLVDLDTPADLARWERRERIVPEPPESVP